MNELLAGSSFEILIGGLIYVVGCGALAAWLADIKGREILLVGFCWASCLIWLQ